MIDHHKIDEDSDEVKTFKNLVKNYEALPIEDI